jgi:tetratricopeptide (TPR) repeat protein
MSEEATNEQGELIRDDKKLVAYYEALSQQAETAGIGYYGLGYIHAQQEEYQEAIHDYIQAPHLHQPYLNNSISYAYIELEQDDNAEPYLLKEAELYLRQNRPQEVLKLLDDPHLASYVDYYDQATLALQINHWHTYFIFVGLSL